MRRDNEYMRNYMRARAARLDAEGLCVRCGRVPPQPGQRQCAACNEARRRWLTENAERFRQTKRAYQRRIRREVIAHYGGKCACCGETEPAFLAIDHINGGGTAHRKAHPYNQRIGQILKRDGYPPGYQVLCHNCNMAKGFYGRCPHQA